MKYSHLVIAMVLHLPILSAESCKSPGQLYEASQYLDGANDVAPVKPEILVEIGPMMGRIGGICTGFIVGPDQVATAAHCVLGTEALDAGTSIPGTWTPDNRARQDGFDPGKHLFPGQIFETAQIELGNNNSGQGTQRCKISGLARWTPIAATAIVTVEHCRFEKYFTTDIAHDLGKSLGHNKGRIYTYNHFAQLENGKDPAQKQIRTILTTTDRPCDITRTDPVIHYNCNTYPGSSGSVLILADGSIALHVGYDDDKNLNVGVILFDSQGLYPAFRDAESQEHLQAISGSYREFEDWCGTIKSTEIPDRVPLLGIDFSPACLLHDRCYDTGNGLGRTREKCDLLFYQNLLQICSGLGEGSYVAGFCRQAAIAYFEAVKTFGSERE
jgi:hypothetical protein